MISSFSQKAQCLVKCLVDWECLMWAQSRLCHTTPYKQYGQWNIRSAEWSSSQSVSTHPQSWKQLLVTPPPHLLCQVIIITARCQPLPRPRHRLRPGARSSGGSSRGHSRGTRWGHFYCHYYYWSVGSKEPGGSSLIMYASDLKLSFP